MKPTAPKPTIIQITSQPEIVGGLLPVNAPTRYPTIVPTMKIVPPMVGVPRFSP